MPGREPFMRTSEEKLHMKHDIQTLKDLQALSLSDKVAVTQDRLVEFYEHYDGNVYVSYSGGKDSTVLLDIARNLFPNIKAVFSNTGLEYPEIQQFVRNTPNVEILRPKMTFHEVIQNYGYPLISKEVAEAIYYARRNGGGERASRHAPWDLENGKDSLAEASYQRERTTDQKRTELLWGGKESQRRRADLMVGGGGEKRLSAFNKKRWLPLTYTPFRISHYCCNIMKKQPMHRYNSKSKTKPILATMATESRMRKQSWLRTGCNAFNSSDPKSTPMAFWTENDVLQYAKRENISICSVYGDIECQEDNCYCTGCDRTGCIFCGFGAHTKSDIRFVRLGQNYPKLYEYCLEGGQWIDNPDYIEGLSEEPDDLGWISWNPKRLWIPSAKGLGMRYVFDCVNALYGDQTIKY